MPIAVPWMGDTPQYPSVIHRSALYEGLPDSHQKSHGVSSV